MLRKKIYKWHRISSLIISIPVLLWAISGFMHPVMTNIRPAVASQWLMPKAIDSNQLKTPLNTALVMNHLDSFQTVRLVHIDTNWFYQVGIKGKKELLYFSVVSGKQLKKGDWLYAQYIARLFLEGQKKENPGKQDDKAEIGATDCCDAAAICVLKSPKGIPITDVQFVTSFDDEYKSINRVLPVYKVSFERKDGIRIYVETAQDRFSLAVDNNRAWFSKFFSLVHNMEWLNFLGKGRLIVEMMLVGLAFLTALMGLYIFFISQSKVSKGNQLLKARRNHRYTAVVFSIFTLLFTFSGFYHAFSKLKVDNRDMFFAEHNYASASTQFDFQKIRTAAHKPVLNIGLITLDKDVFWRVIVKESNYPSSKDNKPKDLMKEMTSAMPALLYINAADYSILKDGEKKYANYLATEFSKNSPSIITETTAITKFEGEYGFVNKRLPVWKISYAANNHERYYVETGTGKLAVRIDDIDVKEALSFNFLHKHHFMDFAGKGWRDFSTMFWVAGQIAMVVIGLILFFKSRKGKLKPKV